MSLLLNQKYDVILIYPQKIRSAILHNVRPKT